MPITLICPNGHRFTRPTTAHRKDGSRCPECNAITLKQLPKAKGTKVKPKPCPAAPGCPQTPECTGCAYDAPKPPHPMMAMQEGQTAQEAKATKGPLCGACKGRGCRPMFGVAAVLCPDCGGSGSVSPARTEAEEHLLDAEESPRMCDLYPVDNDLDDPDSPKHQGAI